MLPTRALRACTLFLSWAFLCSASSSVHASTSFSVLTHQSDLVVDGRNVTLSVPDAAVTNDTGLPRVPYVIKRVLLGPGETVSAVRAEVSVSAELSRLPAPQIASSLVANDGKTSDVRVFDGSPTQFPASSVRYLGTGYWHGYAIASFAVFPVRVIDGAFKFSESVNVIVETTSGLPAVDVVQRERVTPGFRQDVEAQLQSLVVNPHRTASYSSVAPARESGHGAFAPAAAPSLEGSGVDYLIITNDTLQAAFQPLADWKTAKGVRTVIRTTEWIQANVKNGVDLQETIRNFIIDAYSKWGITYVLLGGDTEEVPARFLYSGFYDGGRSLPVDIYFGGLDGSFNDDHDSVFGEGGSVDNPDLYVEVYVGRLPASSVAEAQVMVQKVIDYETPTHLGYVDKHLLLAEVLFPLAWVEPDPISLNGSFFAQNLDANTLAGSDLQVTKKYETEYLYPGTVKLTRQCTIDSLNAGYNMVTHIGHGFRFNMSVGNGSVLNADAAALTNTGKYSNLFMLNCTACAFNYESLAEVFLANPNGGCVSAIGANESAFPNASDFYMQAYYDVVLNQDQRHIGRAFADSRLPRTGIASVGDNSDLWTHYIYTGLFDPEMPLWTGPVDPMVVTHDTSVELGRVTVSVNVTRNTFPVEGAVVCLSKDGDDYQVLETDPFGNALVDFDARTVGDISIVVTNRNSIRYASTISVTPTALAYLTMDGIAVDDDMAGGTFGNGDGIIDAGETVDLTITAANTGGIQSNNAYVLVSSASADVTILADSSWVGVVAADGDAVGAPPLRVQFASTITDGETRTLDFSFVDDVASYPFACDVEVRAPRPANFGLTSAIASGAIDTVKVFVDLKNYGTGTWYGLNAVLEDLDNGYDFFDSTSTYPDLDGFQSGTNLSPFCLFEPDTAGTHRLRLVVTDAVGNVFSDTLELERPLPPDNLVFDPKLGADRLNVGWDASPSSDAVAYHLYRSLVPGGPYTRLNVDPVDHTVFLDSGLTPSTTYYYVATAVDESGNESIQSTEFGGSTNPAQFAGFPIMMRDETTSSPVLGDLDGDGDLEIVVGDDKIYAWHHTGIELLDGDADAQSWGVVSSVGSDFVASIALAEIDANPGAEIIAASRTTNELFVMDHNGSVLSGWPKVTPSKVRAALTVADLDGDGTPEIIAVDESGVIYAWNGDGTEFMDGDSNPGTDGVFFQLPAGAFLHYSSPAAADFDGDNRMELAIGSQSDEVYLIDDDGSVMPGWPYALGSDATGSIAVGDIDGDGSGDLELVVAEFGGGVHALHHDGTSLWFQWFPNSLFFAPSPALGDVTGDGTLETFIASANGNLYAITSAGAYLPAFPIEYSAITFTESSPVLSDLDGDGNIDVILGDESKFIRAWNMSGELVSGFPLATEDAMRGVPTLGDIDNDGDVELIAAGWDKGVYAWDFMTPWDPALSPWRGYQNSAFNDGRTGGPTPTSVGNVAFSFHRDEVGVHLDWFFTDVTEVAFDVDRAVLGPDGPGEFSPVASRVSITDSRVVVVDRSVEEGVKYLYRLRGASDDPIVFATNMVTVAVSRAALGQNFPNPFNPATSIAYWVPTGKPSKVLLTIYNVAGERVRTLIDGVYPSGKYQVTWDGVNDRGQTVGSGVYFYRLSQRGFVQTRKMMLLK